jgi:ATP-binding cassette subfamily B protein
MNGTQNKHAGVIESLRMFWRLLGDHILIQKRLFLWGLFLAIIDSCIALLPPYLMKQIVDFVLPQKDMLLLLNYSLFLIGAYALSFFLYGILIGALVKASIKSIAGLKNRIVESILNKRTSFFSKYFSGDVLTRFTSDIEALTEFFVQHLIQSIVNCLFLIAIIIVLLCWNWRLGLLSVSTVPLYLLLVVLIHKPIGRRAAIARSRLSTQNNELLDILTGHDELRFYQQGPAALARFIKAASSFSGANISSSRFTIISINAIDYLGKVFTLIPFVIGGIFLCRGSYGITVGMMIAYFAYMMHLTQQLLPILSAMTKMANAYPAMVRLHTILEYPEEPEVEILEQGDTPNTTEIIFRDVTFSRALDKPIIQNASLVIPAGEKIAVMGVNGSGKSTIVNLLLRFLAPQSGQILLGGKKIEDLPLSFYLSYFSYVTQQTHIFNQSLRDNIAMGWYSVPEERIEQAAKLTQLTDFVESLPDKYDTVVGGGGISMSGGQRQRIALARAIVRDPEILILDELTAALDSETEAEVLDDIFELFQKQTVICVTHSSVVASRFDRTMVLNNGTLTDASTFVTGDRKRG